MMRILVTNDDGIHSPGLAITEEIARSLSDDVWVVAPETEQSGESHSLTLTSPLRLRKLEERRYAVSGTPTDCVMMACLHILKQQPPDLILSGVNWGSNLADDVTYSGTIAGAMEGTMLGIRSIALSQAYIVRNEERVVPWETAEALAPALIDRLIATDLPQGVFLNVNFPNCPPDEAGSAIVTTQGKLTYGLWVEQRADGRGFPYYWLRFGREKASDMVDGSDMAALRDRHVSVTPLKLDLTAHEAMDKLARALA